MFSLSSFAPLFGLVILATSSFSLDRGGGLSPVVIPPKRCQAEGTDPIRSAQLLMQIPNVGQLEECFMLCTYMTNCTIVKWLPKSCSIYKDPATKRNTDLKSYWQRGDRDFDELDLVRRGVRAHWYFNVQCDNAILESAFTSTPATEATSTMSTRAPDDKIYFLPSHQCIGKKLDGGYSTRFDPTGLSLTDALRTTTVEDCVNFCYLWGNCTAVIFEAGKLCRAFRYSITNEPGFKETNSGRGGDAVLIYDLCCDDEDCRLKHTTPSIGRVTEATDEDETEEPESPFVKPTAPGGATKTTLSGLIVRPDQEETEETEEPEILQGTKSLVVTTPSYSKQLHATEDEGCFRCSFNRTLQFDDFDLGTKLAATFVKAASKLECLLACHFQTRCLAIAMLNEKCMVLLMGENEKNYFSASESFKNDIPSYYAYNIKCSVK